MFRLILWLLIISGVHGPRHMISHVYLNYKNYKAKKEAREKALHEWMHDNGIGV